MWNELLGEFLGTGLLVLLGNGVVANVSLTGSKGKDAGWLAITLGWGLAVTMSVYATGHLSPAHLNPAVTLAFALVGGLPWSSVPSYILAQVLGGIAGAILVWLTYQNHFEATEDSDTILGAFATGPALASPINNLLAEIVGTFVLVFGILSFGRSEWAPGLNPFIVGLLIVSIGLSLGGPTGYAINPARDLGPRIAHSLLPISHKADSGWSYAWVPIVGPLLGGFLAGGFYLVLPA